MGNVEAHDFPPVRSDERKVLNLSRKVTPKQYVKHLNGDTHEACLLELPWNIRDSVSLYETMTVAFHALTELPVELPLRLPHLSFLDLSHNQLRGIPESFGLLFHLKEIHLEHNKLTSLPDSFVHLVKLEKIDVSYNELRHLPEDIGLMERLGRLNVVHNKLRELPLSLGCPSCHVYILLAHQNRLDCPPQAVCEEGSSSTLDYIRKQYSTHQELVPARTTAPKNIFLRNCSNKLEPSVNNPHSAQIQYMQEQTNTAHTTNRIKAPLLPPLEATTLTPFQLQDRVIGLIYGAAVGDAIGLACRWMSDDECAFHYAHDSDLTYDKIVQDEHRVLWRQGDWTANFDQFMLVLESLVGWGGVVDELEFARRLQVWVLNGFSELGDSAGVLTSDTIRKVVAHTSFCDDPHTASASVLKEFRPVENGSLPSSKQNGKFLNECPPSSDAAASLQTFPPNAPLKRLSSSDSSLSTLSLCSHTEVAQKLICTAPCSEFGIDNGAVVRTAILGVPNFHKQEEVEENAIRICRTTHSDNKCVASCVLVSLLISLVLQGKLVVIMEDGSRNVCEEEVDEILSTASKYLVDPAEKEEFLSLKQCTTFSQFNAREPFHMSHVYKPVQAAFIAVYWKDDYRSFITKLTKLAGDSSSNSCVAGAVIGCLQGFSCMPYSWVQDLRKRQVVWLNSKINHLLDIMGSP